MITLTTQRTTFTESEEPVARTEPEPPTHSSHQETLPRQKTLSMSWSKLNKLSTPNSKNLPNAEEAGASAAEADMAVVVAADASAHVEAAVVATAAAVAVEDAEAADDHLVATVAESAGKL